MIFYPIYLAEAINPAAVELAVGDFGIVLQMAIHFKQGNVGKYSV
jgi:hypothetical protein